MRIAILHYAAPPSIGGVEQTIYYQARCLADAGHAVRVIAGNGGQFDERVATVILPEAGSRQTDVLRVQKDLAGGRVSSQFSELSASLKHALRGVLADAEAIVLHNVCTLHKNLALSRALYELCQEWSGENVASAPAGVDSERPRRAVLAWHHDLAWNSPQYLDELHDGSPWDLLKKPWPGVRQVTVSEARRQELARLYGLSIDDIAVVPPGVDPGEFLRWDKMTRDLVDRFGLLDSDMLLLLPARITRRKNIEQAVRTLAVLKAQTGLDVRLIVTGPPGPHNPSNRSYLESLRELCKDLGVVDAIHFLYDYYGDVPSTVVADLYGLCDALLFPSAEEGFGIPVLEAGLARLPIFCSSIPPLQATGEGSAHFFDPQADPVEVAALIGDAMAGDPTYRLRRRVLGDYTWRRIVRQRLLPLLDCTSQEQKEWRQ